MAEYVTAFITGMISLLLFVYVSFTMRGKGPILSNTYLLTPKEDWDKIDKDAEYRMVSVAFVILAISFLLTTIYILTSWKICLTAALIMAGCDVVYAVINSIYTNQE